MKFRKISMIILFVFCLVQAFCQELLIGSKKLNDGNVPEYKFSVYTPWLTFSNFGNEKTNTQHYELTFRYNLTEKDKVGIKVATWKLFAPMGIPLWNPLFLKERAFFPGRLRETGVGATYQRTIWKGLFATVEVLPLFKTYLDEEKNKVGKGFKLYTSYHVGYHVPLFKGRFYIEPQIHVNYWPIDTNTPAAFKETEAGWNNYFLFEPNLYLGVDF